MQIENTYKLTEEFVKNKNKFNLLFLLVANFILGILWITFYAYSYSSEFSQYIGEKIAWLPELVATLRGVGIFIIVWYVITQILIVIVVERKHHNLNKFDKISLYLNWTIIFAVYNIFAYLKSTNFHYLKSWFYDLFSSDLELKETFHRRSWQYIMMVCLMLFMSQLIYLCLIYPFVSGQSLEIVSFNPANNVVKYVNSYNNLWFNSLQYFTNQTNLLCFGAALLFTINPGLKIFKHNSFLMYCATYILIVGLIYNAALLPPKIANGSTANWSVMDWYENSIVHILNPILFLTSTLLIVTHKRSFKPTSLTNHLFYGITTVFPYLTFAMFSTLISANSVYDSITNLNPNVLTDFVKYIVSDNVVFSFLSSVTGGHFFQIIYYPLFIGLFLVLLFVIHQIDKYSYRKRKDQPVSKEKLIAKRV